MFKLPNFPSPKASDDELADFAELIAWQRKFASATDIVRYLSVQDDNMDAAGDIFLGCEDQEDEDLLRLELVFELLGERQRICGSAYPFEIDQAGSVLRLLDVEEQPSRELYLYLLGATRLNMKSLKNIGGVDGTFLMEDICSQTVKEYLGAKRAQVLVLGTASPGGFKKRLSHLITEIKEPCRFVNVSGKGAAVRAQDDGVDVVGWIPFTDNSPGKLIIFAQVKTGTSWRGSLRECQPEAFQKKWMGGGFLVDPIRAFCVAEAVGRGANWNGTCVDAGIFFDRCRIVSCSDLEDFGRTGDLLSWVVGAKDLIAEIFVV